MVEPSREPVFQASPGTPTDPPLPGGDATQNWPVYDGRTEGVSDGVPAMPAPARPPRRVWPWVAATSLLTVAVVAAAAILVRPAVGTEGAGSAQPAPVVAPDSWSRVDASLTAGLVRVDGGAEADGIVLTSSGLVATSYARIGGDSRPPEDGSHLLIAADGRDAQPATIVATDAASDIAIVQAPGFVPASVARPGSPVRVGETLTLLDDQGGRQPILGVGVTVTATRHVCSRAGVTARPRGFQFSLDVASAEPGAALVRADGTVVGMYFGGDDAAHHCAIPIADVVAAAGIK